MRIPLRRTRRTEREAMGRVAVVEAKLLIVITIVVMQLWLLTVGLDQLLAGKLAAVWSVAAISGLGFLIAMLVVVVTRRDR